MPDITILYDQSESDELGIRLTAEKMGIDLGYIPFYKVAYAFDDKGFKLSTTGKDYSSMLRTSHVVLNRCQSKSRRIFATAILESAGKTAINPLVAEENCQSKLKTLLGFSKAGIKIPRTVYVSPNARERSGSGGLHNNTETIRTLIQNEFQEESVVIKPDAGTHGRGVQLAESTSDIVKILNGTEQSIINPSGIMAQELIPKWFYDLRIIVTKKRESPPVCHGDALARGGFKEFRTNTFLGNMVVRARLPESVRRTSEACAEVLAQGSESYVLSLDAMPTIPSEMMENEGELRQSFMDLEIPFEDVTRVKGMADKKRRFGEYTDAINRAYSNYMDTDAYRHIEGIVNETLAATAENVVFHEANACPDFWEQTRIVGGINVAKELLECAQSALVR